MKYLVSWYKLLFLSMDAQRKVINNAETTLNCSLQMLQCKNGLATKEEGQG